MSETRLYQGDCLEVLPTIADKSIDFIVIESDAHYFQVAKDRIEQKRKQGIQGELFQ